jgi:hypothetical protein
MNGGLCRATIVYVGIGKGGKIKCFLTKESGIPATRMTVHATIAVLREDGNVGKNTETFHSFEKAQRWLESHFDELSIVELQPVPKAKS